MKLEFDAESHTYRLDGHPAPGVTSLLQPLYDFSRVPRETLEAKQRLGTAVHLACQLDDEGDLDEASVADEIRPYLDAYRKFKRENEPTVLMNEVALGHPILRYCGTVDRVMEIDGRVWVIDLKTAVALYPPVGVQLAAYAELVKQNRPDLKSRELVHGGLKLKADGTYQLKRFSTREWNCFLSLLIVHNWKSNAANHY